jgi:hypothetical protein
MIYDVAFILFDSYYIIIGLSYINQLIMKKALLSLLFVAGISPAFAQTVKYGISGGLNASTVVAYDDPASNSRFSFHAGVFSDISFGNVSIQSGLFYTTKIYAAKGSAQQELYYYPNGTYFNINTPGGGSDSYYTDHSREKVNYLQVPVNILYHIKAGSDKFFIGGGPYIAYGLSGTSGNYTVSTYGNTNSPGTVENPSLHFGSGDEDVKRVVFGLNALGGFALKNGLFISAGYDYGLTNINNNGYSEKNGMVTVSVGYSF